MAIVKGKLNKTELEVSSKSIHQAILKKYVASIEHFYNQLGIIPEIGDSIQINKKEVAEVSNKIFDFDDKCLSIELS